MPDLHAINLHLQERLERDWRDEVPAREAARWLHDAGLLHNYENDSLLLKLLRAGRIAGQQQRPNRKDGEWFIRRLADSSNTHSIEEARERLRRCLPIDRKALPQNWPVDQGPAAFWQELGKTVAAFGYLEYILTSCCFALLSPKPEELTRQLEENDQAAMCKWIEQLRVAQTDPISTLTGKFHKLLDKTGLVPHTVLDDLIKDLHKLQQWRNALCHGAWLTVAENGTAHLHHLFPLKNDFAAPFPHDIDLETLSDVRAQTVDLTIRIAEVSSIGGPFLTHAAGNDGGYAYTIELQRTHRSE